MDYSTFEAVRKTCQEQGVPFNLNMPDGAKDATAGFSFGDALAHLKGGRRVARAPWGQEMWLHLIPASHWETTRGLSLLDGMPWIGIKTPDDKFVPWVACQPDMLADDWVIVP